MWNSAIGRLRLVGLLEGASFLVLLGIAMPLKYLADEPLAVRIVGSVHGALFVIFCGVLAYAAKRHHWPLERTLGVFVAALVPFGPFFVDGSLKREQVRPEAALNPR